ncbi:MAG TPA: DUF4233 domain-containing protein [Pseudonocardiaceae bacterium]|nr:DUF4233 domain-containing protein [Pseudonocardiaceae bacterium]
MSDQPVQPDPLRGLRGIFAGTLVMEAIVVGLALLVVNRIGAGLGAPAGWYTAALALAMVVAAFVQRRSWGLGLALALQVAMVVGWFASPALGALGLLFLLVWGFLLYVRWAVQRKEPLPASRSKNQ